MANPTFLVVLLGILAAVVFLVHNAEAAPVVLYGKVGDTIYQHGIPKISFIVPEDGSDKLVYQYPQNPSVGGAQQSVLTQGTRISYEFVKSEQPEGYAIRDKAVNVQSVSAERD